MTQQEIAQVLRAVRRAQEMTQKELGARMGVHSTQISAWERGDPPTLETLLKWVDALGMTLEIVPKK